MGRIRVLGRRGADDFCAYCRDDGPAAGGVRACPGCGVTLHGACWEELARCPLVGCPGVAEPAPSRARQPDPPERWTDVPRPPAPPGLRLRALASLAIRDWVLPLVSLGAVLSPALLPILAPAWCLRHLPAGTAFDHAAVVLGGALVVGLALALGLDHCRRRAWPRWLRRRQLLEAGLARPMRLQVLETGGGWAKVALRALGAGVADPKLEGQPLPELRLTLLGFWSSFAWLAARDGERVWVRDPTGPGPYLVEFSDGLLTVFDPDS